MTRKICVTLLQHIEQTCGPEHHETLNEMAHLAHWTGKAGYPAAAVDLYRKLVVRRERICGEDHPETVEARKELARWQQQATPT